MSSESFRRAVTVHRDGCEAAARGQAAARPSAPLEASGLDLAVRDGASTRYELAVRPVYEHLRRVIGQISGLIILQRMGGGSDLLDLPEVAALHERMSCLDDALASLSVPGPLEHHADRLRLSNRSCRTAAAELADAARGKDPAAALDRAGESIRLAYAALQAASDVRAGLLMVDFSHACCSCSIGSTLRTGDQ